MVNQHSSVWSLQKKDRSSETFTYFYSIHCSLTVAYSSTKQCSIGPSAVESQIQATPAPLYLVAPKRWSTMTFGRIQEIDIRTIQGLYNKSLRISEVLTEAPAALNGLPPMLPIAMRQAADLFLDQPTPGLGGHLLPAMRFFQSSNLVDKSRVMSFVFATNAQNTNELAHNNINHLYPRSAIL